MTIEELLQTPKYRNLAECTDEENAYIMASIELGEMSKDDDYMLRVTRHVDLIRVTPPSCEFAIEFGGEE